MGPFHDETFRHEISLGPKDGSRFETVQALVETGSTCAVVPAPVLGGLGVTPEGTSFFELSDGRQQEYGLAEILLRLDGHERTTIRIFGNPGSEPLLGTYALEGFDLAADPVNQRLSPARWFLGTTGPR